jgi:phosphatidate phosphatase APP1
MVGMNKPLAIKIYHGFGHIHDIVVYGHVFRRYRPFKLSYSGSWLVNLGRLLRLFLLRPVPRVALVLEWQGKQVHSTSSADGFFRFEWSAAVETMAGWHPVIIQAVNEKGEVLGTGEGKVLITHRTQYGFISDVDDTVLRSHSGTTLKRLRELLFKHPHARNIFTDTARFYRLLANSYTTPDAPNPFFYISSSEWNLYDYLAEIFRHRQFPAGVFLLNQVKRWYSLLKTGKTKHEGKLLRILRVLEVFPHQRFILLGDNSQQDPEIYSQFVERFSARIVCVYIRNVRPQRSRETAALLHSFRARGVQSLLFDNTAEAIAHATGIALIDNRTVDTVKAIT